MAERNRGRRWRIIACIVCVMLAAVGGAAWYFGDSLHTRARRQWKDQAIVAIEQRLRDPAWINSEASRLAEAAKKRDPVGGWVGEEMVLMRNGDWIICQSIAAKEQRTGVRRDLFIGRGSDGRWYYSTFHFCVGKVVLSSMEGQSDSLAQFVQEYWLAPFDGKSDECLEETWPDGQRSPAGAPATMRSGQ